MTIDVHKAMADPTRRRILQLLRDRPMTAGELAASFELAKPTLSGHFAVLREAGLIVGARAGTTITYSLNLAALEAALMELMDAYKLFLGPAREPRRGPPAPERVKGII